MSEEKKVQCPQFPFFGASYPDAGCVDGKLWDLDQCDENGLYSIGDNPPCPFCNTEAFIDYMTDIDDKELEEMNRDETLSDDDRKEILMPFTECHYLIIGELYEIFSISGFKVGRK